jgi:hypothetical protein
LYTTPYYIDDNHIKHVSNTVLIKTEIRIWMLTDW